MWALGKDRGKPPGVHDPTRTRTPEGYVCLPRGKGYVRGTSGTPGYVGYPGVGKRNATKVHPHEVVAQRLPAHSLHTTCMVVAQHLRCTRARQQWGLPWVPLAGSRALTRWWHGCLHRCEGLNRAGGCGYLSASKKVRTPSWFNNELKMTRCEGHECVQVSFVVLLAPGIEAGNGDGGKEGSTATGNLDCK